MELAPFLEQAESDFVKCLEVLKTKNHDYANSGDVLKNFKFSSQAANITPSQSILVLIGTKISRLSELVGKQKENQNEKVEDTILDMINYLILLKASESEKE